MNSFINPYLINAYFYCENQCFIFNNKLYDTFDLNIAKGRLYDEDNNKIKFENFEIDSIDKKQKVIIEYKKPSSNLKGSKYQLLYYLYLLKDKYKNFKGKLICIEDKVDYIYELSLEEKNKLFEIINNISNLTFDYSLIHFEEKCIKCGCFDFCHS